jgi:membrane fusion protein, multidrug efflux system
LLFVSCKMTATPAPDVTSNPPKTLIIDKPKGGGSRKHNVLRWIITLAFILVVIGSLFAIKGAQIGKLIGFGKQAQAEGPPAEAVSTSQALEQEWEGTLSAVGSVASAKGVTLAADAPGNVTRILFESGDTVKQGQVLLLQDTNVEQAQLASAIARRNLATTTIERTRALAAKGAIAPAQLDADESALRTATTDAESIQAQIAKKTVRAPFAGKLGIRSVNMGQYLQPGNPIAVLETSDAVHVDFTLSQQRLGDVKVGQPVRIMLDTPGGGADAGVPDVPTSENAVEGTIAAVDPTVDQITRTIKLRADVQKRAEQLRPGMFVQVAVILPGHTKSVVAPQTAIVHAPYGDSVFVVEEKPQGSPGRAQTPDGKPVKVARQQFVRTGMSRGDFVAIVDGVKAGQELVTAGAFKLRNNAPIYVDNTKGPLPKPQLAPHPENH